MRRKGNKYKGIMTVNNKLSFYLFFFYLFMKLFLKTNRKLQSTFTLGL